MCAHAVTKLSNLSWKALHTSYLNFFRMFSLKEPGGLTHDKAIDSKWIEPDFLMRTTKSQQSREVPLRTHKPARTQNCAAVMRRFGALLVLFWWRAKGPRCHNDVFCWTFTLRALAALIQFWGLLGQAFCDLSSVRRHVHVGHDCMRLARHRQYWMHWRRAWKQHFDCGYGLCTFSQKDAHISTWEEFDGKFEEPFELLGLEDPECPKKEIRAAFRQVARPVILARMEVLGDKFAFQGWASWCFWSGRRELSWKSQALGEDNSSQCGSVCWANVVRLATHAAIVLLGFLDWGCGRALRAWICGSVQFYYWNKINVKWKGLFSLLSVFILLSESAFPSPSASLSA